MNQNKKPKRLFERLKDSLEQGVRDLRREIKLKSFDLEIPDPPPTIDKRDVASLRDRLKLSLEHFARLLNVPSSTVRLWEAGTRKPTGAAARLLQIYSSRPEIVDFVTNAGNGKPATHGKSRPAPAKT